MKSDPARARQNTKRLDAIIFAAGQRFARDGYTAARIEDIALEAEVAPATVYNYFGDKPSLLITLFERYIAASATCRQQEIINLPQQLEAAFTGYIDLLFDRDTIELVEGLGPWNETYRTLWREAYAASYTSTAPGRLGSIVTLQDSVLREELEQLFEARLPKTAKLDAVVLADIILAVGNMNWTNFLTNHELDHVQCADQIKLRGLQILRLTVKNETQELKTGSVP